jgi:hypothetical protein
MTLKNEIISEIIPNFFCKERPDVPAYGIYLEFIGTMKKINEEYFRLLILLKKNSGSDNSDSSSGDSGEKKEKNQKSDFFLRLHIFLMLQELLRAEGIEELKKYLNCEDFKNVFFELSKNKDFMEEIENTLNLPRYEMIQTIGEKLSEEGDIPLDKIFIKGRRRYNNQNYQTNSETMDFSTGAKNNCKENDI